MKGTRNRAVGGLFICMLLAGISACGHGTVHEPLLGQTAPWSEAFDLDGDDINDRIEVSYTGGAHCCYRLAIWLSQTDKCHILPFQLDGGYVGGLDLSQPDRFAIRKTDGKLPELLMRIETYNGTPQPLPEDWKKRYGIRSHHIAVGGRLRVRDWPPGKG